MKYNYGERMLASFFNRIAKLTVKYPLYFIIIPFLVSVSLSTGLLKVSFQNDIEYLFPPRNSYAYDERQYMLKYYSMDYINDYDEGRELQFKSNGRTIIMAKDKKNVLRDHIFEEIELLDKIIRNITIHHNNMTYKYEDICARVSGKCFKNDLLGLKSALQDMKEGIYKIEYPLVLNNKTWAYQFYGNCLGDVILDEKNHLLKANVAALGYHLQYSNTNLKIQLAKWEDSFLETLGKLEFKHIYITRFVSKSFFDEFGNDTLSSMKFFSITVFIMLMFSVLSSMMSDCVRSKPWFGIIGCISSTLAVASGIGFCLHCGMEFITVNFAIPFVMLGIGLDDTFVILAAWRKTDIGWSLEKRMCETYKHAGVSITITSLTNIVSFIIGSTTPFKAANILCSYMAISVFLTYIYQLTFFGGWMVYLGRAEENNLNSIFFVKSIPKSLAKHHGTLFKLLMTGGRNPEDPNNPEDNKEHQGMIYLRDKLGNFLCKPRTKVCVILTFFVYIIIGIYGSFQFKEGLEMYQIFGKNTYAYNFAILEQKYFYKYIFRVSIIVKEPIDYSSAIIQDKFENIFSEIEAKPFVGEPKLNESWLKYFKIFIKDPRSQFAIKKYNLTNKMGFINCIRQVFFKYPPAKRFVKDIVFNENYTEIISSRHIFQGINLYDTSELKTSLLDLLEIFKKYDIDLFVYHPLYLILSMFLNVMLFTLQTIGITSVIMMIITFFFIPSIMVSVWVCFSIISIECGLIGFMTLWGVHLNPTSLVCIIVCIGFSVDNSAHIAYAFVSSKSKSPNEKMKQALYSVGVPILQACISTLIGVLVLPFTPSYNFMVFFKTISLVMIFASCHSLILLPVLLSLTDEYLIKSMVPTEVEKDEQSDLKTNEYP